MLSKVKQEDLIIILSCIIISLFVFYLFSNNKSFVKIVDNNIDSIVEIECKINDSVTTKGTGIVVNSEYIITNYHIIKNSELVYIRLFNTKKIYQVEVAKYDVNLDLALLRYNENDLSLKGVTFGDSNKVTMGEEIVTIGNSKGYGLAINNGVVSSYVKKIEINEMSRSVLQISVPIVDGDSGGAAINKKAQVIGMMAFKTVNYYNNSTEEISFAIPSNIIKDFINGD